MSDTVGLVWYHSGLGVWYRIHDNTVQCASGHSEWGPSIQFQSPRELVASRLPLVANYLDTQPIDKDLLVDIGL